MKLQTIFLSVLFITLQFAFGADNDNINDAEFRGETKAKIEFMQEQNKEIKIQFNNLEEKISGIEAKTKSVEEYKNIIERQDKRIEDVNSEMASAAEKTSWLAVIVALITLVFALGGGILPFVLYQHNKEAQENSKLDLENFKNKIKLEFETELKDFKEHADNAKNTISDVAKRIIETSDSTLENDDTQKENFNDDEKKAIREDSQTIAKSANSYEDWTNAATLAYRLNNYGDTLSYIDEALLLAKDYFETVKALLAKGITLGKLNKSDEAIKIYDNLIEVYQNTPDEDTKGLIAYALFYKGTQLGKLDKNDEALSAYYQAIILNPKYLTSYTNVFELLLTMNKPFEKTFIELFKAYAIDDKRSLLLFNMLNILKNGLESNQEEKIKELKKEYSTVSFDNWSWKELEEWAYKLTDEKQRERTLKSIEVFKHWES